MRRHPRLRTTRTFLASGLLVAAGGLAASPARAHPDDERSATPEEATLISEALAAQGYTEIRDIDMDHGRFEVEARHPDGHEVDLELDPETLEILHEDKEH